MHVGSRKDANPDGYWVLVGRQAQPALQAVACRYGWAWGGPAGTEDSEGTQQPNGLILLGSLFRWMACGVQRYMSGAVCRRNALMGLLDE